MKLHIRGTLLLLIALTALAAAGCERGKDEEGEREVFPGVYEVPQDSLSVGARGGSFVRADIQELDTLNPVVTRSRALDAVLGLVFESLLSVNPYSGKIQGGIASDFSIVNDGLTILLRLNQDVRFSDGRRCTAEDVVFTFEEIYMNPDIDTRKSDTLRIRDGLVTVRMVDPHTVQMDLPAPYRPFLYTLTRTPVLPAHLLAPLIDAHGSDGFNELWGSVERSAGDLVGTGPYRIDSVRPGESLILTRNPHYRTREGTLSLDGMPYLDSITVLLDLDADTRLLMFQVGKIDFYRVSDLDVTSGNLDMLVANRSEGTYRLHTGGRTLETNHFLAVNQQAGKVSPDKLDVFTRVDFRQALSHLIDRRRIVDEVFGGYGFIDGSPERSVSPFHRDLPARDFDRGRAEALLDGSRLVDRDGDGFRETPAGAPFSFTILTNAGNPLRVAMGGIIVEDMRRAGLDVTLLSIDYDTIVAKLMVTFEWDTVLLGFEGAIDPNDASWIWESSGTLHLWHPYQERPATDWERRIDELFALGRTTWSFDGARAYYEEYQRIVHRRLPVIPIVTPAEIFGVQDGYGNLSLSSVTFNSMGTMPFVYRVPAGKGIDFFSHSERSH